MMELQRQEEWVVGGGSEALCDFSHALEAGRWSGAEVLQVEDRKQISVAGELINPIVRNEKAHEMKTDF